MGPGLRRRVAEPPHDESEVHTEEVEEVTKHVCERNRAVSIVVVARERIVTGETSRTATAAAESRIKAVLATPTAPVATTRARSRQA